MLPFFVYMLRCADGAFYVGHTDNLESHMTQHAAGTANGFTAARLPVELVWSQETESREEALEWAARCPAAQSKVGYAELRETIAEFSQ